MKVGLFIVVISLVGCSIPIEPNSTSIKDADAAMVESCQFMGNFDGGSGFGLAPGISRAKNDAREQAVQSGVTHIVWTATDGSYASTASGIGYKCQTNN